MLDEVLGLEVYNFSRQLKMKPEISDDHQVIVAKPSDLWFRGTEKNKKYQGDRASKRLLEAMVSSTKPEANGWLHLTPRIVALGTDAFERAQAMITKFHAYLMEEARVAENAETSQPKL